MKQTLNHPGSLYKRWKKATAVRVAMRQIVGVFSQLEKTRLVKKLKAARDRKRASGKGRYTGRKSHVEKRPAVVALVGVKKDETNNRVHYLGIHLKDAA